MKRFYVGLLLLCCVLVISTPSCRADALSDLFDTQTECYRLKLEVEASIFRTDEYKSTCQTTREECRSLCNAIDQGDERYWDCYYGMIDIDDAWTQADGWYSLGSTDKAAADIDLLKSEDFSNGRTVGERLADALTALDHYRSASNRFEFGAEHEFDLLRGQIAALISLAQ